MEFKIIYPINSPVITQKFGNPDSMYLNMGMKGHNGIDFRTIHGTPLYATHDGYASYQVDNSGGHGVVIITDKPYTHNGEEVYFKTIYWHLPDPLKEPKLASPLANKTGFTKVEQGDLIGYADNTGMSTGDHLHFGLKIVAKGEDNWTWYNTNQTNGYFGAIDPTPFFNNYAPANVVELKKKISILKQLVELYKQLLIEKKR